MIFSSPNPRIRLALALIACFLTSALPKAAADDAAKADRQVIDLSGTGWTLWRDADASWQKDELFLPPADLRRIPMNPPTGGWQQLDSSAAKPVSVPGTAEEYLGNGAGPDTAVKGVTWWTRTIHVPSDIGGRKIRLLFDSARLRAEVYLDHKLVAYDVVGNTPFEADLTGLLKAGSDAQLAVRITNPGGNFDWRDVVAFQWGKYRIPASHGFGGITGGVRLVITDPVYLDDIYVQNTPAKTAVNVIATVMNATTGEVQRDEDIAVRERSGNGAKVFEKQIPGIKLAPGPNTLSYSVSVAGAKLWDLQSPNLYDCVVRIGDNAGSADSTTQTFGFRWFSPEGIGSNAMLRLNGKRVVLRTAISWGFWPITGLFPTDDLAEKQIRTAKTYGLNMLNFHRCIGNPVVLDKADQLGLLYFEEPGGYVSGENDPFAQALCREKLLRMVKRDRSHPSLIIYNMINEQWDKWGAGTDEALFSVHQRDLRDAHALDPSRTLLYTSAWAGRSPDPNNDKAKMNMRPFDGTIHMNGWWDYHRAGGPATWEQSFYKDPDNHYGLTKDKTEVVYWGEEGAISAPPRLARIKKDIEAAPYTGWDSQVYLNWYKAFDDYLTQNNLRRAFPTVDDLCKAMGVASIEHQGRKIEDTRICDLNDGYAINGWESELIENHSGVVDCYRNAKADPGILAYYNQPLYVAVKPRAQIAACPGSVLVDFYLVNEGEIQGQHTLQVTATAPDGQQVFSKTFQVNVTGGDVYSQMAAEGVIIPVEHADGMTTVTARLVDAQGVVKATGHDGVLAVDWKKVPIRGHGAVCEVGTPISRFLKWRKGVDAPAFDDSQPKLDWLLVAKSAVQEPFPIPASAFVAASGTTSGTNTTFFSGRDFSKPIYKRTDNTIDFTNSPGSPPDPNVPMIDNYSVRWEGQLVPPADGQYTFAIQYSGDARVFIDGRQLVNDIGNSLGRPRVRQFGVKLTASKPVPVRVELLQKNAGGSMQLLWKTPIPDKITPAQILERARRDGTTVVILDRADTWLPALAAATGIPQGNAFPLGLAWLGGQYFVKAHPLFDGLPVNQALNWPYQDVVNGKRLALDLHGGELVAGAWRSWPMELGAAVSIFPLGQGRVIVSSLDITSQLANRESSAEVARKLFCNFLSFASKK